MISNSWHCHHFYNVVFAAQYITLGYILLLHQMLVFPESNMWRQLTGIQTCWNHTCHQMAIEAACISFRHRPAVLGSVHTSGRKIHYFNYAVLELLSGLKSESYCFSKINPIYIQLFQWWLLRKISKKKGKAFQNTFSSISNSCEWGDTKKILLLIHLDA